MALLISACAVTTPPATKTSPLALPEAWVARAAWSTDVEPWLDDFNDSRLIALVEEAVVGNFDLRATAARVDAARSQARVTGADRLPQVEIGLNAARTKRSGVNDQSFVENPSNSFRLQGEVSWEADVWGRLAHAARASIAEFEATAADYRAATLSLAANVAREWFQAIEATQQLRLAEQTVASFADSLAIVEQQYRRGIGDALDVRLARQNLATAQSNLALRQRQHRSSIRTLESLLGRYPAARLDIADSLPEMSGSVPSGLPSQLLIRRPDLVAGERRLVAADERFLQARDDRLPRFRLTANGGTTSDEVRDLLDPDFLVWSLLGNLTQPLFQGGRLQARVDLTGAQRSEAFNRYTQAILTALQEVENTLDAEAFLLRQEAALRVAAKEARQAEELALARYAQGLAGIITLLEAQRRSFNSDSALLETSRQRLQNRVNLYLALGGDFASPSVVRSTGGGR